MANDRPVIANGVWYPSLTDAARAAKCSKSTMHRRVAKKKGYSYAGYADRDALMALADEMERRAEFSGVVPSVWLSVCADRIREACGEES